MPAGQGVHEADPLSAEKVPAAHGFMPTVDVAPVVQKKPRSHGVHSVAALRPTESDLYPAGHGSGADAPLTQNVPAGHTRHAGAAVLFW